MAGRIAHDLNNYLTAILGYGELLQGRMQDDPRASGFLAEMLHASGRAQDFSCQLQAFSGRLIMDPQRADLNEILLAAEDELLDLVGPQVELRIETDHRLPEVEVDVRHANSMFRWLVLDAVAAMCGKGSLRLSTAALTNSVGEPPWALVTARDTGVPPAASNRLCYFEPFVPGDGVPKGIARTGVAGVVRQHGGRIELQAPAGGGRCIRIRLPGAS
jgi:signal transduction histidine kinase